MKENENNGNIMAEIEKAIDMTSEETIAKQPEGTDKPAPKADAPETVEAAKGAEEAAFVADDALIERAVKAGLSVADAKAFANADQADRILAALEAKAKPTSEAKGGTDGDGNGFPAEEFDGLMKKLEDGDFEPDVLAAFKQLGNLVKEQSATIAAMKAAGSSAAAQTSFDKSYDGLDAAVRDHVDAATKSKLKAKFDFLKSAHESAKDKATDEEVFEEAKKLVLGDIISKADEENKAAQLEKRKSLALARPGGESGARQNKGETTVEDIAGELFKQLTT